MAGRRPVRGVALRCATCAMVRAMRAVVYQHETHEDLGLLEPALRAAGFAVVNRFRGVAYHDDVSAELLVVLGGSMSTSDDAQHPFLRDELAVLVERLGAGKPCLGLCLGAQLMALAAGGEVFVGKNGFELGVAPIRWTNDALADPVIRGVGPKPNVVHWHHDTWRNVPNATLLASTDRYTQQAFRLGPSYAFQFHPELTSDAYLRWLEVEGEALSAEGKDVAALKTQAPKLRAVEAEWSALFERLVHHFAQLARSQESLTRGAPAR